MIEINVKDAKWLINSLRERVEFLEDYSKNVSEERVKIFQKYNVLNDQLDSVRARYDEVFEEKTKIEIELEEVATLRKKALETVNELNRELEELKVKYELATTMNKMSEDKKKTKVIGVGRPKK